MQSINVATEKKSMFMDMFYQFQGVVCTPPLMSISEDSCDIQVPTNAEDISEGYLSLLVSSECAPVDYFEEDLFLSFKADDLLLNV